MMKKKLMAGILALVLAVSLCACGDGEEITENRESRRNRNRVESSEDEDSHSRKELDEDKSEVDKPGDSQKPDDSKKPAHGGMLGINVDADYDGFEYLYCETLMTESKENPETGKMESRSLNVFVPQGDYVSVDRDSVYTSRLGVTFRVTLNPYIRYEQDDYTLKENMEYYLERMHDPFEYAKSQLGLKISEVEKTVTGGMRAEASYCSYNSWDEEYIAVLSTYYLVELDKDLTVLVEVKVDSSETTGKTELLLEELETFYGFHIEWSTERADQALKVFLDSPEANKNYQCTGYMILELPMGWKQDWSWSDNYSEYCYAPDGDAEFAECVISVQREYVGSEIDGSIEDTVNSQESMDEVLAVFQAEFGEEAKDLTVENYGSTVLGPALKMSCRVGQDGYDVFHEFYFMTYESYSYTFHVIYTSDTIVEDVSGIAENVIAAARVK